MKRHSVKIVLSSLTILICAGVFSVANAQDTPLFGTSGQTGTLNWSSESTTVTRKIGWTFRSPGTGYLCGFNTVVTKRSDAVGDYAILLNLWSHGSTRDKPETGVLVASKSFDESIMKVDNIPEETDKLELLFDNCALIGQGGWYSAHLERTVIDSGGGTTRAYVAATRNTNDPDCIDCWYNRFLPVSGGWEAQLDTQEWIWTALGFSEGMSIFDEPTSDAYGFDPDQDFGFFGNMLRDIGKFLFVPSEDSLHQWENTKDRLFDRVPFSYIEEIQTVVSGLSIASSSFPSLTYDLTPYGINASGSLFGVDTVSEYLPGQDIGYFRIFMESVLWILFAIFIWQSVMALFKPG